MRTRRWLVLSNPTGASALFLTSTSASSFSSTTVTTAATAAITSASRAGVALDAAPRCVAAAAGSVLQPHAELAALEIGCIEA